MSRNSGVIWQVLAPVVRWPLWSPRRLGLVLALVAVVCLVLAYLNRS